MFIQSQVLAWEDGAIAGRPGAQVKMLSSDSETGAATALIRYPAGYKGPAAAIEPAEEILLLHGALRLNDRHLVSLSYARLPRRWPRQHCSSDTGAVALTMFSSAPTPAAGAAADAAVEPVIHGDLGHDGLEGWVANPYTRYLVGTGVRPLFENPQTGEISILYSALPFRYMEKRWSHPDVQEMYMLAGSYAINDVGVMAPGAYAWWQGGEFHGPYGSRTGFMMFIRSVGGPLANLIKDERIPVDYDAPYRPRLPEHMRAAAKAIDTTQSF
jgi:hypothetical protein